MVRLRLLYLLRISMQLEETIRCSLLQQAVSAVRIPLLSRLLYILFLRPFGRLMRCVIRIPAYLLTPALLLPEISIPGYGILVTDKLPRNKVLSTRTLRMAFIV